MDQDGDAVKDLAMNAACTSHCSAVDTKTRAEEYEASMRVVIQSFEPYFDLLDFIPTRVLPFMRLPQGVSFPGRAVLKSIFSQEKEKNYKKAAATFIQALLSSSAPSGMTHIFLEALYTANDSPEKPNNGAWKVHDILRVACFCLPLQETFLKLVDEDLVNIDLLLRHPGFNDLQKLQIGTLKFLDEKGGHYAAMFLLVSVYAMLIENLYQLYQRVSAENAGFSSAMPDWIQRLVDALHHQVGDKNLSNLRLPKTWSILYEELSFQKKARQREEAAGENDECAANVDAGSTPVTTKKAFLMADKNEHIHAFLKDNETLNVANLSGYLNTEFVEHSFEHQRTRVSAEHSDDSVSVVTSLSNEDNLMVSANDLIREGSVIAPAGSTAEITLRDYQEELLSSARRGKNCLILLPTGTGKTFVIIKYIEEILSKGGMDHILFVAPKVRLVQQQYKRFQKYLTSNTYFRCGSSRSNNAAFSQLLDDYRIFVMTPMCLVEAILAKEVRITDFSLIILDECHNTQGDHPYKKLMNIYMDSKFTNDKRNVACLPQIVGLTASPGVGKGGKLGTALAHLRQLCISMDVQMICTVKTHKEELERYVSEPSHEIHRCSVRKKDGFKNELESMMKAIENEMLKSVSLEKENSPSCETLKLPPASSRGKQFYTQWVCELESNLVRLVQNKDNYAKIYASAEMLKMCQRALLLNEDCESQYALDFLNSYIISMQMEKPHLQDIDKWLLQQFKARETDFVRASRDKEDFNPKLKMLEDILLDVLERDGNAAACMVFVKTLDLVEAIISWMEKHLVLKQLSPGRIIGCNADDGMSKSGFSDVMAKFNSGIHKAVVCTSAADEGLDFQACNVVVRYNYVTNVIAMIQTRGRARHMDSQYCVLDSATGASADKEQENLDNERLMEQAVLRIQNDIETNPNEFAQEIERQQRVQWETRLKYEQQVEAERQVQGFYTNKYKLLCRKCQEFACNSDDIRVIENNCHVVVNENFAAKWDKVAESSVGKAISSYIVIFARAICMKCSEHWGVVVRHVPSGRQYPTLKLENFIIQETDDTGNKLPGKIKWSKAPFYVPYLREE